MGTALCVFLSKVMICSKVNIWLKKEIEYDDEKCHLISFLNFHGLLRNPSAVLVYIKAMCVCSIKLLREGGGVGFSQNS